MKKTRSGCRQIAHFDREDDFEGVSAALPETDVELHVDRRRGRAPGR